MGFTPESPAAPRALLLPREEPGFPFRGPGLLARVAPFAVVAALAQASLLLPPGVESVPAAVASVVLLAVTGGMFALPWTRLPEWLMVLVPLTYTGSVLALMLAAGTTSGVGVAILIPLVWTALFHRRWESACIVVAIVTVMVIVSLVPTADAGAVIARRVLLWGLLGVLISVATHGLRDRIARSQRETALLQEQLREATIMQDRDRIATGLQDEVIQRIFAAGLALQSAASLTSQPEVQGRVEAAGKDLDRVVRLLRDTVFGLGRRTPERGLRQEILDLCGGLSPVPEVSFAGPIDRTLSPKEGTRLAGMLRVSIAVIGQHAVPSNIAITAGDEECLTVIETVSRPGLADGEWADGEPVRLREQATLAGARITIQHMPGGGTRFAWHLPLAATSAVANRDPGGALGGLPGAG